MKKGITALAIVSLSTVMTSFPAYAFDWPPKEYDMPRTVLTVDLLGQSLSGLAGSIRAIANTGLMILGIWLSVCLIGGIFNKYVMSRIRLREGVEKRELQRVIRAVDRAENMESIVNDRVAEMEVSAMARQRYRELHPRADIEERIYQRELAYNADLEYQALHPRNGIEKRIRQKEISYHADLEYQELHPREGIEKRIRQREITNDADWEYRELHPEADVENAVYRKEVAREANLAYQERHPEMFRVRPHRRHRP